MHLMDLSVLALCVAAHGFFGDDPLAAPEPAPAVPHVDVVGHHDGVAQQRRRAALAAARGAELIQRAKPGERNVIVAFATQRCRPCDPLLAWLDEPSVSRALAADYAIVVVDHDEPGAGDLCVVYAGSQACVGYPVVVVVDARGVPLTPGQLGVPDTNDEATAFVAMLARHGKHLDARVRAVLVRALLHERPTTPDPER